MAATGPFLLTICFALFLTEVHSVLQCYTGEENECSPSGPSCDTMAPPSENVPYTITECDANVTKCVNMTFVLRDADFTSKSRTASCLAKKDEAGFSNGCYDWDDFDKIDPVETRGIKVIAALVGLTIDDFEACICDGNLCNGSTIPALSISVIISSVVMSLMSFM